MWMRNSASEMVAISFKNFKPFETAGIDGTFSCFLQNGSDLLGQILASLKNECIPLAWWQEAKDYPEA